MSEFYPGDKVRFLNEDGEGVVIAVQGDGAMVRTPDGFEIPYPAAQLVKFGTGSERLKKVFNSTSKVDETYGQHGIFIAYIKKLTDSCPGFLVNRTSYDLYYSICEQTDKKWMQREEGKLPSGKFAEILSRYTSQVDKWPELSVRIMYLGENQDLPEPKVFEHKVQAKRFLNTLTMAPLINKDAFLFQLDGDAWNASQKEMKDKLKNMFSSSSKDSKAIDETQVYIPEEIDLHIEAIPDAPSNLGVKSILKYQVNYAETMLDKAIAAGKPKIIFIHGAGDGTLKREVQNLAKANPHVSSYGKGNPNKYGGGATFLKIE